MKLSICVCASSWLLVAPSVAAKHAKHTKQGKKSKSSKRKNKTHNVSPGDSIQAALDEASDGDVIKVKPGTYTESSLRYGLRVTKNNIKLHATGRRGEGVRLIASGSQETGIYAAPEGCEYLDSKCAETIEGFDIRGISVENFPRNGIQTRWMKNFKIYKCQSVDNLNNGIYPTLSSGGEIKDCKSSGSLDSGLWGAGSSDVKIFQNEISQSTTGLEVTVSRNVYASENKIHDNCVGIGLYHPNMAGTEPGFPSFDSWVFEHNHVYNNNLVNTSPAGTFQSFLPSGLGVLLVGVNEVTVRDNFIDRHDFAGMLVAGYCSTIAAAFGSTCEVDPPKNGDPAANFNTIVDNIFVDNGGSPSVDLGLPGVDILYVQSPAEYGSSLDQNCFEANFSSDGITHASYFAAFTSVLPTEACY